MKTVLFALAVRNLVRHPRRTVLTVLALAIGLAALLLLWGFNDGLHANMARNFQQTIVGSLQVHRDGFFRRPDLGLHLELTESVVEGLERAGARPWTTRVEGFGLAASAEVTEGVMLMGMDPTREPLVTRLPHKLGQGRFFRDGEEGVCVLGAGTAKSLGVGIGDTLVVVAYSRFGEPVAEEFTLVGLITSGETGIDRGLLFLPLSALQSLLEIGERVTSVVVSLELGELERVTEDLRVAMEGQGLEVLRWYDMFPAMREWIVLHDGFLFLFMGVVLLLVLGGVLNTLLLSMLERTREFGVLMALGNARGELLSLVVTETALIGVAGVLLGSLLGVGIVLLGGEVGLELGALLGGTSRFYVDPVIYPQLDVGRLAQAVVALLAATVGAGLYPAWRASRLEPLQAIRGG